MQNWDSSLQPASYESNWYGGMFPQIKTEPQTTTSTSPSLVAAMDHYLNMKQHHQQTQGMTSSLTPSPRTDSNEGHSYFDANSIAGLNNNLNQLHHHHQHHNHNHHQHQHPLGFNPLTPPGLPNAILPPINFHDTSMEHSQGLPPQSQQPQQQQSQQLQQESLTTKLDNNDSLTPRNTPPMDITPPKSPKLSLLYKSEYLDKESELISNSSELLESEDDDTIRMPIYNSHGKMKNYKCKSCGFMAITKIAFWTHARSHMKPEKLLECPKCPFVTELKHHLEYHIRKHKNLKPFQCDKCNYSCVNKSMLNSHLKSHSSVYQYRCTDCDYATKYCHSFKLHLRKYDHKPGMVLDEEGLPNPAIIIDVYGTRRGPKSKSSPGNRGRISKSNSKESRLSAQSKLALIQKNASPIKTEPSTASMKINQPKHQPAHNMHHHLQSHQLQPQAQTQPQAQPLPPNIPSFLPNPLANMLQQRNLNNMNNMPFFPYWNLNLQMLAAQQHAVLSQLSPRMREAALQSLNGHNNNGSDILDNEDKESRNFDLDDEEDPDHDDDDIDDQRSESSAMDLSSQGTPTKLNPLRHSESMMSLKLAADLEADTPTITSSSSLRRKGRVLKLDTLLLTKESSINSNDDNQMKCLNSDMDCRAIVSAKPIQNEAPSSSCGNTENIISNRIPKTQSNELNKDDLADSSNNTLTTTTTTTTTTQSTQITNGSHNNNSNNNNSLSEIFECKYCDIYFKDAVLYTIHMGYHSCDDAFKCNMCGEKCDGPVGLFVHMARNAHS